MAIDSGKGFGKSKNDNHRMGIYRTYDPLQEFKIKVRLKKIAPLAIVKAKERRKENEMEMENLRLASPFEEERVFLWQSKVFCRREISWYSNSANCKDFVDKKYHETLKSVDGQSKTSYLFCYVDVDVSSGKFIPPELTVPILSKACQSKCGIKSFISATKANEVQGQLLQRSSIIKENAAKSKGRIDTFNKPKQTMFIMADFNCCETDDDSNKENEKVLCTITANNNGVITVSPDFNKGDWYEAYNHKHEVFLYNIEHVSNGIMLEEAQREKCLLERIYNRRMELVSACLSTEFELPPPQTFLALVFGEIVSAETFELDNLCVHYFFELPENWQITDVDQIVGITQTCATTVEGKDNVAYFAFPFEAEFTYKITDFTGREIMPNWPQLFIEVVSFDRWERYCVEGYTYMCLPSSPGTYELHLPTWKPVGHSPVDKLRRFFIGGASEVEDLTYVGIPSTFDGSQLSRLAVKTQSSGTVTIRLNIVHQSEIFAVEHKESNKAKNILSYIESTSKKSISDLLSVYQRARSRMLAARVKLQHLH